MSIATQDRVMGCSSCRRWMFRMAALMSVLSAGQPLAEVAVSSRSEDLIQHAMRKGDGPAGGAFDDDEGGVGGEHRGVVSGEHNNKHDSIGTVIKTEKTDDDEDDDASTGERDLEGNLKTGNRRSASSLNSEDRKIEARMSKVDQDREAQIEQEERRNDLKDVPDEKQVSAASHQTTKKIPAQYVEPAEAIETLNARNVKETPSSSLKNALEKEPSSSKNDEIIGSEKADSQLKEPSSLEKDEASSKEEKKSVSEKEDTSEKETGLPENPNRLPEKHVEKNQESVEKKEESHKNGKAFMAKTKPSKLSSDQQHVVSKVKKALAVSDVPTDEDSSKSSIELVPSPQSLDTSKSIPESMDASKSIPEALDSKLKVSEKESANKVESSNKVKSSNNVEKKEEHHAVSEKDLENSQKEDESTVASAVSKHDESVSKSGEHAVSKHEESLSKNEDQQTASKIEYQVASRNEKQASLKNESKNEQSQQLISRAEPVSESEVGMGGDSEYGMVVEKVVPAGSMQSPQKSKDENNDNKSDLITFEESNEQTVAHGDQTIENTLRHDENEVESSRLLRGNHNSATRHLQATRDSEATRDSALPVIRDSAPLDGHGMSLIESKNIEKDRNPPRVVSLADLHGDFQATLTALKEAKLVDDHFNWNAGKTVLVQTGDIVDRGDQAREIYDILFKLQDQAKAVGGEVILLLGNHEAMRLQDNVFYRGPNESSWMKDNPPPFSIAERRSMNPYEREQDLQISAQAWTRGGWIRTEIEKRFRVFAVVNGVLYVHGTLTVVYARKLLEIARHIVLEKWIKENGLGRSQGDSESSDIGKTFRAEHEAMLHNEEFIQDKKIELQQSMTLDIPLESSLRDEAFAYYFEETIGALSNSQDLLNPLTNDYCPFWSREYTGTCDNIDQIHKFLGVLSGTQIQGHTTQETGLVTPQCNNRMIFADTAMSEAYRLPYPKGGVSGVEILRKGLKSPLDSNVSNAINDETGIGQDESSGTENTMLEYTIRSFHHRLPGTYTFIKDFKTKVLKKPVAIMVQDDIGERKKEIAQAVTKKQEDLNKYLTPEEIELQKKADELIQKSGQKNGDGKVKPLEMPTKDEEKVEQNEKTTIGQLNVKTVGTKRNPVEIDPEWPREEDLNRMGDSKLRTMGMNAINGIGMNIDSSSSFYLYLGSVGMFLSIGVCYFLRRRKGKVIHQSDHDIEVGGKTA